MCGPHFCSMELTQQLREYAEQKGLTTEEAIRSGLDEKATEFRDREQERLVQLGTERRR